MPAAVGGLVWRAARGAGGLVSRRLRRSLRRRLRRHRSRAAWARVLREREVVAGSAYETWREVIGLARAWLAARHEEWRLR